MTWGDRERVTELAAGLLALGLRPEQRVIVFAATRVEWVLADLADQLRRRRDHDRLPVLAARGRAAHRHRLRGGDRLRRGREQGRGAAGAGRQDPGPGARRAADGAGRAARELSLDGLAERGRALLAEDPGAVEKVIDGIGPDDLCTLIYTSGTTGRPKGVRLVQDNWTYEGAAIDALGILGPDDLQYLWLPLSHSFGKVLLAAQVQIGFATAIDGRIDKIVENLAAVKPTFMAGAPRIFEKVHNRVIASVEEEGGVKAKLFAKAFQTGRKYSAVVQQRRTPGLGLKVAHAGADTLVLSKLRERFGGRIRLFISGSAPLSRDVAEWFHAAGMLIVEGYGMTESSAAATVNLPDSFRFGTVGPPLPGTEMRIADDGELLLRGPSVMRGYHRLPEATAETLDADGWLHTGDIGEIDPDGLLRITDRKKDLIKTSGGKYVAPAADRGHVPGDLRAGQPVHRARGRSQLRDRAGDAGPGRAGPVGPDERRRRARPGRAGPHEDVRAAVAPGSSSSTRGSTGGRRSRTSAILDHDLTVESGELTPSLKLKRRVVEQRYKAVLDEMYASGPSGRACEGSHRAFRRSARRAHGS